MSYIGTTEIGKMFLGDVEIDKAYLGTELVFEGTPPKPTYTFTANPSSYSGDTLTSASNAYTSETSTTYARVRVTTTAGSTTSDYFIFNTSSIPQNAEIKSVTCEAKAYITATTNISPRRISMYSGTTAKGSAQSLTTSAKVFTFSGDTWTREELSDARVRIWATRSSGSTTSWLYFYGATLTVTYTV